MRAILKYTAAAVAVSVSIALGSCSKEYPPQHIIRLDKAIEQYPSLSLDARGEMIDSMAPGLDALFMSKGVDEASDSLLEDFALSPAVQMFMPEIDAAFADLSPIEAKLGNARGIASEKLPEMSWPEIYSVVLTSRDQSIFTDGELMLLGLNHYLGSSHPAYDGFPTYITNAKSPERIPVDVTEAIIGTAFPFQQSDDNALLYRLLYEGAIIYAMHTLLPELSEAAILGYTDDEYQWLNSTEAAGWNKIVSNQYLYSTDPSVAIRLFAPAPATAILNSMAPGRAGRYYGYRIVSNYVKNNSDAELSYLLSPDFYNSQQSLIDAKYAPR